MPVYIVGGAVRDALAGRPVTDIDLAVAGGGTRLARRIANALDGEFYVLDRERDVGRALLTGEQGRVCIDVAGFRAPNLAEDLAARDFTINAMAVALRGELNMLIDPLGGEADAGAKLLRQCRADSLRADPLRVLRAIRLAAQFGLRIEPATLHVLRENVAALGDVSPERLRDEFWRLLALPDARRALHVAARLGVLEAILPGYTARSGRPANRGQHANVWEETLAVVGQLKTLGAALGAWPGATERAAFAPGALSMRMAPWRAQLQARLRTKWANGRSNRALLTLALMLEEGDDEHALQVAQRFRLARPERARLLALARGQRAPLRLAPQADDLEVYRYWRATGAAGVDCCLLAAARCLGEAGSALEQQDWLTVIERIARLLEAHFERHDTLIAPDPLLDGHGLMRALDMPPGPAIGQLLEHLREARVAGCIRTRAEALDCARDWLAARDSG